jgi:hypothetical protein
VLPFRGAQIVGARFAFFVSLAHVTKTPHLQPEQE